MNRKLLHVLFFGISIIALAGTAAAQRRIDRGERRELRADAREIRADTREIRGFQVQHWTRDGMAFWAVSDLNHAELDQFVRALTP